jgi:ribosomal protein L1
MKHSRRYREIKEKISHNKHYNSSEAIDFLQNNNPEKLKNIKVSFSLYRINQKTVLKTKLKLPYPVKKEEKIAIIKEELPEDILKTCQENKEVELLTVEELTQKTIEKGKVKKKSQ